MCGFAKEQFQKPATVQRPVAVAVKAALTVDLSSKEGILTVLHASSTVEGAMQKTNGLENRYLVYRMLQALYERQTTDEKAVEATRHTNGRGFTHGDARLLSSIASAYDNITPKQAKYIAPKLMKYATQLTIVAAEKKAAKKVQAPVMPTLVNGKQVRQERVQEELAFMAAMRSERTL